MNRLRILLALVLSVLPSLAFAWPVVLTNFSPTAGEVAYTVNGGRVAALRYRGIEQVEIAGGSRVRAERMSDGRILAELQMPETRRQNTYLEAILLLGDGVAHGYELFHDFAFQLFGMRPEDPRIQYYWTTRIGAAPFPGAHLDENAVRYGEQCSGAGSSGGSSGSFVYGQRRVSRSGGDNVSSEVCRFNVVVRGQAITVAGYRNGNEATMRTVLIGDGSERAPFEVLVLRNAELIASTGGAELQPGQIIHAASIWYDAARPAQSVSLFEEPASEAVYGSWYTFDGAGRPVWYLLDGAYAEAAGRRDVLIRHVARVGNGTDVTTIGTGRIVYADCNEAEFRAVIGEEVRSLSLRRTRPVKDCSALE